MSRLAGSRSPRSLREGMAAAIRSSSGALACACALAGAMLFVPAGASGSTPPTAGEFERRTEAFLGTDQATAAQTQRGGGIGDVPAPSGGGFEDLPGESLQIALYGAPQLTSTAVGKRSPAGAAKKLKKQAKAYRGLGELPRTRSINLIGVIALATPGSDGKYRARQDNRIIRNYLEAARSVGARLTLDIQPGRSTIKKEMKVLKPWLREPDVDVGIDPEWNVGRRGVPGRTEGSIGHKELNKASAWLADLVKSEGLPPKAMIVHQFRQGSIKGRKKLKARRARLALTLNFDGIGSPAAKRAGYKNLSQPGLIDGFSLFYDRDTPLLKPERVVKIRPVVAYAMYQ